MIPLLQRRCCRPWRKKASRASLPLRWLLPVVMLAFLLAAAGLPTALGQAASPPHFQISGTVVNALDGSALPRCRMAATLGGVARGLDRQPVEAQSDERGRFTLEVPSAGSWRLTATGRNLHQQPYEGHEGFFTGIVLTTAQPVFNVVFRAVPDAVVTGLVVDEAGEAVRNAPVFLVASDPDAAQTAAGQNPRTQQAMTDDQGRYEFSGLDPGSYLVNVRARPWYAPQGTGPGATASLDPSLDVVYPVTWYPGTSDDASATPLTVRPGEHAMANFHLLPVASAHLRMPLPAGDSDRGPRRSAQVALLLPNGGTQQVFGNYTAASSGEIDVGGLSPGTYQVTFPGASPRDPGRTTIVRIGGGGTVTEVGSGAAESTLTLSVDGDTALDASAIALTDTVTRRVVRSTNGRGRPGGFNPGGPGRAGPGGTRGGGVITPSASGADGLRMLGTPAGSGGAPGAPAMLELPAGRYEVSVRGNSGVFLTGLSAKGAEIEGRFVTVHEGSASLTVHLAAGLASVDGVASFHGKPAAGALVLLVPATLGQPTSLTTVHRDQSNTDGSFHLAGVTPGPYILVAIDHGWGVRWSDPATLAPHLLHGTPLDVRSSAAVRASLEASAP